MSPGLSVKLPLRKEEQGALDERDDRSDLRRRGQLPWKDDRADGGGSSWFLSSPVEGVLRAGGALQPPFCGGRCLW